MTNANRLLVLLLACSGCTLFSASAGAQSTGPAGTPPPIDPQKVQDQDDMTWADYKPIPGVDWADMERKPTERTIKVALIAADFPEQDFVITMKKNSDLFGNPQIDPIKREDVAKFYADFWNSRSAAHNRHTVNEYWMEQSHGKIGVSFTPYGPYKMPKRVFQYGLSGYGQQNSAPPEFPAGDTMTADCDRLWLADAGNVRSEYNLVLRMFAGYDETCVWQEFGEMKFQDQNSIAPEWGNPDPNMPRWAPTRYTPWTSWKAAQWLWSNSAIIQGECSGSIVHEVSHAAFSIGDNNNNPYVTPYRRVGAGAWDIMDRGSFNGPGGPHDRWQIPVVKGGAMPAGIMLRNKIQFGFVEPANLVRLSRDGLAKSGMAVVNVLARSAQPGATGISGVVVQLDGEAVPLPAAAAGGGRGGGRGGRGRGGDLLPTTGPATTLPSPDALFPVAAPGGGGGATTSVAPGGGGRGGRGGGGGGRRGTGSPLPPAGMTFDRTPWVDPATDPLSPGIPDFNNYTIEVVQRIGYDSFCPDSGVLLAKNKDQPSTNGGPNAFTCFNWTIDAHPEDINKIDFKRPNGEQVMRTVADYRQLNDCLFHAGLNSGSQYEWQDAPNRLHFYVIDRKEEGGILSYTIGIRSLDGSGAQTRGVTLAAGAAEQGVAAANTRCELTLTNTGIAGAAAESLHPMNASPYLASDVYRLSVSVDGAGWTASLQNALAAVKAGGAQKVPVFVTHAPGSAATGTVTVKAVSESDPTKTSTTTFRVIAN